MDELKQIIAENITFYRKELGLTQAELTEKLSYSDKAVSKWERGESYPDIATLAQLSRLFNITIDQLITSRKKVKKVRPFVALLSSGLVWLVITVLYALANIIAPELDKTWLLFLYAIPINAIVLLVLFAVWKHRLAVLICESAIMWSVAACLFLSLIHLPNMFFLFFIPIPLQVLALLWYKKDANKSGRINLMRRRIKK